jgi:hypothetical protein
LITEIDEADAVLFDEDTETEEDVEAMGEETVMDTEDDALDTLVDTEPTIDEGEVKAFTAEETELDVTLLEA